jgi:hypothetical protein
MAKVKRLGTKATAKSKLSKSAGKRRGLGNAGLVDPFRPPAGVRTWQRPGTGDTYGFGGS